MLIPLWPASRAQNKKMSPNMRNNLPNSHSIVCLVKFKVIRWAELLVQLHTFHPSHTLMKAISHVPITNYDKSIFLLCAIVWLLAAIRPWCAKDKRGEEEWMEWRLDQFAILMLLMHLHAGFFFLVSNLLKMTFGPSFNEYVTFSMQNINQCFWHTIICSISVLQRTRS